MGGALSKEIHIKGEKRLMEVVSASPLLKNGRSFAMKGRSFVNPTTVTVAISSLGDHFCENPVVIKQLKQLPQKSH